MSGGAQILEKEVVEFPSMLGDIKTVETEDAPVFEQTENKDTESSGGETSFARRGERFARLQKHLRKRSVSIL